MPTTDDARIGDFSRPVVDPARKPPATDASGAPPSPTKEALEAAETRLDEDASKDEAALKPMATFEEKLKEAGLSREKAAEIIDAVLLKGFYAEDIKITSTVKMRLRTRNARDTKRAQEILEAQRFTIDAHYSESWGRLLLAASLESFGNDKFVHPNPRKDSYEIIEKSYQERIAFVDALPDPALRVMLQRLYKFDSRVSVALEEGSIENF
jgi:hypothetical protein